MKSLPPLVSLAGILLCTFFLTQCHKVEFSRGENTASPSGVQPDEDCDGNRRGSTDYDPDRICPTRVDCAQNTVDSPDFDENRICETPVYDCQGYADSDPEYNPGRTDCSEQKYDCAGNLEDTSDYQADRICDEKKKVDCAGNLEDTPDYQSDRICKKDPVFDCDGHLEGTPKYNPSRTCDETFDCAGNRIGSDDYDENRTCDGSIKYDCEGYSEHNPHYDADKTCGGQPDPDPDPKNYDCDGNAEGSDAYDPGRVCEKLADCEGYLEDDDRYDANRTCENPDNFDCAGNREGTDLFDPARDCKVVLDVDCLGHLETDPEYKAGRICTTNQAERDCDGILEGDPGYDPHKVCEPVCEDQNKSCDPYPPGGCHPGDPFCDDGEPDYDCDGYEKGEKGYDPGRSCDPPEFEIDCENGGKSYEKGEICVDPPPPLCDRFTGVEVAFLIDSSSSMGDNDCPGALGSVEAGFVCRGRTHREKMVLSTVASMNTLYAEHRGRGGAPSLVSVARFTPSSLFSNDYLVALDTARSSRLNLPLMTGALGFTRAPVGRTPYLNAARAAADILGKHQRYGKRKRIAIMITDGEPTDTDPRAVSRQVDQLREAGITWYTVKVNTGSGGVTERRKEHWYTLFTRNMRSFSKHPRYNSDEEYFEEIWELPAKISDGLFEISSFEELEAEVLNNIVYREMECSNPRPRKY